VRVSGINLREVSTLARSGVSNVIYSKSNMRLIFFFCLFFLLAQISFAQESNFYDAVLKEVERSGSFNFIALDIDSISYKGRAVIENGDLYFF
jgi:type IV secretory pathway VirB3-like protein